MVFILLTGCNRAELTTPGLTAPGTVVDATSLFRPQEIGRPWSGQPWIAHVSTVDLDGDGRLDVLACEARSNEVLWLRQMEDGSFAETVIGKELNAPVQAATADLDDDGDLDVLVASMGMVFPNNDKIGSVIVLENDGAQNFTSRVLLENVARVTDVRATDFNGDGLLDLAVAQFGYDQGEIRWMEQTGPWAFTSHSLLELSGTINVCVADMTGDNRPDIVALVSQQWEEVHLFTNNGDGTFADRVIFGSTNEDFASSNISLCDVNHDGRPDVLYTNGDGFGGAALPGPRPWHGVQWLENRGNGFFQFHRVGDLAGAFSPVGTDLDGDGRTDIVAVSAFNDWDDLDAASLVWFRNIGNGHFVPHLLARAPIHQLTLAAGQFSGHALPELVTGGFNAYPPVERMGRVTLWRRSSP